MKWKSVIIGALVVLSIIYYFHLKNIKRTTNENTICINTAIENEEKIAQELCIDDEVALELQETEDEGFELQGEIAYESGENNIEDIQLGEYKGLTYYSQVDNRWKNNLYTSIGNASQTIGISGCGPTSAAMIVSSIKGEIKPDEMSNLYVKRGYRSANNGTYWSAFRWTADVFNIEYKETSNLNEAIELVRNNNYIIVSCGNGLFTTGGHFIVIVGIEGDTLKIYDSYLYNGKFETSTRKGKVRVEENTIYCSIENFRKYSNYKGFFSFKNAESQKDNSQNVKPIQLTYSKYVKANGGLNVRTGPEINYKSVNKLKTGTQVTIYETNGNWSRIGEGIWICSDYLYDKIYNMQKTFNSNTIIYSNLNLTGNKYYYLPKTTVTILDRYENIDKIRVNKTGRTGFVSNTVYK